MCRKYEKNWSAEMRQESHQSGARASPTRRNKTGRSPSVLLLLGLRVMCSAQCDEREEGLGSVKDALLP